LCGYSWPRRGRLELAAQCPGCDLFLERREHDFFLGGYTLSLFACLLVAAGIVLVNVRWESVWAPARYAASAAAIVGFAWWFYPVGKMVWLVIDIQFRPPIVGDFEEPPE